MHAKKHTGLSTSAVADLYEKFGSNVLPEGKHKTKFDHFIDQFRSPLIYILVIAGIITFFLKDYKDSVVIFAAVFVNTILGYYQEVKAEESLQALKGMLSPTAKVIRDGSSQRVPTSELVPGDIVILGQGARIPADGVLVEAVTMSTNEAILTGESTAVRKKVKTEVFMGTHVLSGRGVMEVTHIGTRTKMGSIAGQISSLDETKTPLQNRLSILARNLAVVVLGLSALILVIGLYNGTSFTEMFSTSVALAVASIPEGMAVSLTVILAVGMQRILKKKALVRRLVAAETLGSITVIATDKTGTLTEGMMKVTKEELSEKDKSLEVAVYANNLEDPLEIALWEWTQKNKIDPQKLTDRNPRSAEQPFNSDRKFMSATVDGIKYIKGAPEVVMSMCYLPKKEKMALLKTIGNWSEKGLRMVALAYHKPRAKNATWAGVVGFEDPIRKNIYEVMKSCKSAGIRPIMITGDYAGTARAVWKHIHRKESGLEVVDGQQIEKMSEEELAGVVDEIDIFARVSPSQKLRIVEALHANQEVVALVGDGVNDAPALKKADIGIVVGSASDVSKETADMVLLDSNFKTILAAIEEGRSIFDNMRKVILYLLSDAFAEIILVIGTLFLGLPLPLTAAQILWINVITDGLPAISLTVDPKDRNILRRKPINPNLPLLDFEMKSLISIISGITGIMSLVIFVYYFETTNLELARTVTFASLAFGTLVYIFSVRSLTQPIFTIGSRRNYFLYGSVAVGVLIQLASLYIVPLMEFLNNVAIRIGDWYIILLFTGLLILIIEITKFMFSRLYAHHR